MTLFEILVYSIVIVKAFFAPSNAPVRSTRPTPVPSAGATPVRSAGPTLYQYAALSFGIEQGRRGRRRLQGFSDKSAFLDRILDDITESIVLLDFFDSDNKIIHPLPFSPAKHH